MGNNGYIEYRNHFNSIFIELYTENKLLNVTIFFVILSC